jgi:hypothetical protein
VQIPQAPVKEKNTLGLIAVVVAIIGFIFACVPGALVIGWVLLPIAFILGIAGMFQSGKAKQISVAAIIISIVGAVVGVSVFTFVVSDSFRDAFGSSDLKPSTEGVGEAGPSPEKVSSDEEPGTRQNPVPIGQTVTSKDWEITLGVPREAGAEVAGENPFNERPKSGFEFWIVPVTATYIGDESGSVMFGVRATFVGSDNRTYGDSCGVIPDPLSDVGELYKGGVAEGNECVSVPAGADGLWAVTSGIGDPVFFTATPSGPAGTPAAAPVPAPTTRATTVAPDSKLRWQFQSRTGNIACDLNGSSTPPVAICEVREHTYQPKVKSSCEPRWVNRVTRRQGQTVEVTCYPGTDFREALPVQNYGAPLTIGSLTCVIDEYTGVTCKDSKTGHYFQVARQAYELR